MGFRNRRGLVAALLVGMSTALPLPAAALDDAQKQEFGAFIREYLLANPELIEEMSQALEIKKEAESRVMAQARSPKTARRSSTHPKTSCSAIPMAT
jgi:hypothetical protein